MRFKREYIILSIVFVHVLFFVSWYAFETFKIKTPAKIIFLEADVTSYKSSFKTRHAYFNYHFSNFRFYDASSKTPKLHPWAEGFNEGCLETGVGYLILRKNSQKNVYEASSVICAKTPVNLQKNEVAMRLKSMPRDLLYEKADFGIDRFKIPYNMPKLSGKDRNFTVEIGLDKGGNAHVRGLYLNGELFIN